MRLSSIVSPRVALIGAFAAGMWLTASAETYHTKSVEVPSGATMTERLDIASRVVPTAQQLAWQESGLTAFLHFGMNTFTNREWGDGKESETLFNPTALDADQWVSTLKKAGFKLVILTAKHHDGFCLWPTATTAHSVASSPWLNGKGDVVKMLREACDRHGMKLGIYLSPWDRNAPVYGDSEKYNDMFVAQLRELLGNYGKVDEVWFDGACGEGPNGKKQVYDWPRFRAVMEELQPEAVLAITGDDVRWVGNEDGTGRETEWSVTPLVPPLIAGAAESNKRLGITDMSRDLGSRDLLAKAESLHWWPSEVDVSIRPGWFYHPDEQPKTLRELADIYLKSVGRNSTLLLNIPPDRRGKIAEADSVRLMQLNEWITANFSKPLGVSKAGKGVMFKKPTVVNCVALGEDITRGQRVEEFVVEGLVGKKWRELTRGTTVGHRRIVTFPDTKVSAVTVRIVSSRAEANLKPMEVFRITMPAKDAPASQGVPEGYRAIGDVKLSLLGNDIQASLPSMESIAGFVYTPHADRRDGTIYRYKCEVSPDWGKWYEPEGVTGEFGNIMHHATARTVMFDKPIDARYLVLRLKEDVKGRSDVPASWEGLTIFTKK